MLFDISYMSPIGTSIMVGVIILIYMMLMSISVYLPPILLICGLVSYIVYVAQKKCDINTKIYENTRTNTYENTMTNKI